MQDYRQFIIKANPFNIDLLSGVLWELDILGINEYDDHLKAFVYENSKVSEDDIKATLDSLISENLIQSYIVEVRLLENKNWNEEWEKKINVIDVSDRIVIKPTFRDYQQKEDQIVIIIDPKMSFGTGEHQTTKLVLQLVEKYHQEGNYVLDVGSGTSVLGIAAAKLGAEKVVAVDNDEWCYINGKENVERNNISNLDVLHGTIDDVADSEFDLVLANINKNVLIEIKQSLYKKIKHSGLLIISGILDVDLEEIKRQFTQLGLTALDSHQLDEWIGLVFKKA
jgi:ribosomal protein L11 methyltransferase